jgi:alpha-L-rhamnosidase
MRPVNTVVNAFHYQALVRMAQIAEALGKTSDAAAYRQDASRVAKAVNEKLFDAGTGLYVDGEGSTHSSLHANMFPLAFGMVPEARLQKVAEFVRGKGMACSVYGAQYLMEALYAAGLDEHARKLITAPGDRSWRHMVEDVGTTIALEAWDNKYKPNQDWNHAWGAAPANTIPRFLMGIEALEPGFGTIRIRPQPGQLETASMDLPTIRGAVHVDFKNTPDRFSLNVRIPGNTTARVYLPRLNEGRRISVDEKIRVGEIDGRWLVVDGVGAGKHSFRVDR